MAGCFGNHPFDRAMESQLFQYLDQCGDVEKYYEEVAKHETGLFPESDGMYDEMTIDQQSKYEKFVDKLIDKGYLPDQTARIMIRFYKQLKTYK